MSPSPEVRVAVEAWIEVMVPSRRTALTGECELGPNCSRCFGRIRGVARDIVAGMDGLRVCVLGVDVGCDFLQEK